MTKVCNNNHNEHIYGVRPSVTALLCRVCVQLCVDSVFMSYCMCFSVCVCVCVEVDDSLRAVRTFLSHQQANMFV